MPIVEVMSVALNALSAVAALLAARGWWRSARVVIPDHVGIVLDSVVAIAPDFEQAMKEQARLNQQGATFAALAALLMAAAIGLGSFQ